MFFALRLGRLMELNVITILNAPCCSESNWDHLKMEVQLKNCIFGIADRPVLRRGTLYKI